jgi:hypothetical protein
MTFRRFDAGKGHRSPDNKGDCQVRALCTARNIPYNDAWELLYAIQGEQRASFFRLVNVLQAKDPRVGVIRYLSFPAKKGKRRMNGEQFVKDYPKGRFILNMAKHVAAVVDGALIDTWDSRGKCVYGAWEVKSQ